MIADPCPGAKRWRTALSARLDGETTALSPAALDEHLATCKSCAEWYCHLLRLAEQMASTAQAPDLTLQLIGVTEAHICGCHRDEPCECTHCQCISCTCAESTLSPAE